ncbi:MAG: hypothetical protein A2083_06070 [Gemmatimonadetes bacterium GWC2_71_9]|nr:MAG: hypothetical protein A2083_06070 [Gemmatimonadetes bacterium GWC2_71_9]
MSAAGRRLRAHAARIALAPLVAGVVLVAFPRSPAVAPAHLAVGSVAGADVIAPVRFLVLKSETDRAREAEAQAATVKPIVTPRPEAAAGAVQAAARFFAALDSAAAAGAQVGEAARRSGLDLTADDAAMLARTAARGAIRRAVLAALAGSAAGVLAPGVSTAELGREVVLRRAADERVVPVESVRTFGDFLEVEIATRRLGTPEEERVFVAVLGLFFRPTLVYERAATEARRDALRRTVDSVAAVVLAGQKIVGAHEVVTEQAAQQIDALRAALRGSPQRTAGAALQLLGRLGLATLVVGLFGVICFFYRPEVYRSVRALGVFAAAFALVALAAGLLARGAAPRIELIPVALPAILLAVVFDGRIAAVAAMGIAALVGAQPALRGTDALVFCFVGGVGAALSMRRIRSRTQAYGAIVAVAALYAVAAAVSGAAASEPLRAIGVSAALGSVNALGSAALAMLLLPLAESFTHSTTDLRLLELSDPNHPLLRRLAIEAPGTYAHSVAMANLCEAACNAIGANGLLARVGCYYHDVGKLRHPQFFAENQGHGKNPHDQLSAAQSATVIRLHVEEGLALAGEHHVPEVIRRFIPEHHGTLPITYFLERARDEAAGQGLDEAPFRYPGPLPQSAETAVALLVDSVEAALRVLDDPTPETIEDAIAHLVEQRVAAGQLREAPLTLRQIDVVQRELVRALTGMYHDRVEYPEEAGGLSADWEGGRGAA